MDGVRWFGLQPRQEDTLPEPRDSRRMTSLKDTLIAFVGRPDRRRTVVPR